MWDMRAEDRCVAGSSGAVLPASQSQRGAGTSGIPSQGLDLPCPALQDICGLRGQEPPQQALIALPLLSIGSMNEHLLDTKSVMPTYAMVYLF